MDTQKNRGDIIQMYKENEKKKTNDNKLLIALIIITIIIIILLIIAIKYLSQNTTKKVAIIDEKENSSFYELIKFENDDKGNEIMLFPIKEVAKFFGYKAYNGEYKSSTEDKNKCYVIADSKEKESSSDTEGREVAIFELGSNVISKLDLTDDTSEYEKYQLDIKTIQRDGELYTSVNGLETAFNIDLSYDSEKQLITIFTLGYLNEIYTTRIQEGYYKGYKNLDTKSLKNEKALLENMLIVQAENGKYGVIKSRKRRIYIRS